jgi:quercetin dioxygenase-like cupin family protein
VAAALQVELASFFTQPGPRPMYAYTPKGKGKILTRDGSRFGYAYEALALNMPGKRAEPFLLTIRPGDPQGQFAHEGQEFIYMLSGSMEFVVGEEVFTLKQGDSLYFNATVAHRTRVLGSKPAKFICVFIEDTASSFKAPNRPTRRGRPGDSLS